MNKINQFLKSSYNIIKLSLDADKKTTLLYIACGLIRNARWPFVALVTARILDLVQASSLKSTLDYRLIIYILFYFILFAMNRLWWPLNSYSSSILLARLQTSLKRQIMENSLAQPLEHFEQPENINKLTLAYAEVDGRRPIQTINQVVGMICSILSTTIMFTPLLFYKPVWALLALLGSYGAFFVQMHYGIKSYQFEKANVGEKRKINYINNLFEDRSCVKEMHVFKLFDFFLERQGQQYMKYNNGLQNAAKFQALSSLVSWLCNTLIGGCLYFMVINDAVSGVMQIGLLSFYIASIESVLDMVQQISQSFGTVNQNNQYINNLVEFITPNGAKECTKSAESDAKCKNSPDGYQLEFRDVSFRYPESDEYVLKNVSFTINGKGSICLVGANGAGKSTIVKLLLRLYEPTSGAIYWNGKNVEDINQSEWMALFDVCFQDYYIYGFNFWENITIGDWGNPPDINKANECAKRLDLDGRIIKAPKDYETCVGKEYDIDGIELSGGEKQRLAVARAMYGSAPVIVMDEPTSSLDAKIEKKVFEEYQTRADRSLGICITHRLSYAAKARYIMVIDNGQIVEQGAHKELLEKKGEYYRLFTTQSERYQSEGATMK